MSGAIEYLQNIASEEEIAGHLADCDDDFTPPLSERVAIKDYAGKIASKAMRFEAWSSGRLIGLVAAYCNNTDTGVAFITSVSVLREWAGRGVSNRLLGECVQYVRSVGMRKISLQVARANVPAIKLYEKNRFVSIETDEPIVTMELDLAGGKA